MDRPTDSSAGQQNDTERRQNDPDHGRTAEDGKKATVDEAAQNVRGVAARRAIAVDVRQTVEHHTGGQSDDHRGDLQEIDACAVDQTCGNTDAENGQKGEQRIFALAADDGSADNVCQKQRIFR